MNVNSAMPLAPLRCVVKAEGYLMASSDHIKRIHALYRAVELNFGINLGIQIR